jgi:hypothetical protein
MPYIRTPAGITPPAPGLENEEPEFMAGEDDIPRGDGGTGARERNNAAREDRAPHKPERE